ncbi:MAG TPA: hypothetical protein VJY65_01305 [Chloroflexota bacterium]|nr:hypothetical protein [Chloroflexota bacterium]
MASKHVDEVGEEGMSGHSAATRSAALRLHPWDPASSCYWFWFYVFSPPT